MKRFITAVFACCITATAFADGHGNTLSFEPRQSSTDMTLTSVNLSNCIARTRIESPEIDRRGGGGRACSFAGGATSAYKKAQHMAGLPTLL